MKNRFLPTCRLSGAVLCVALGLVSPTWGQQAGCRPGDIEIGRQETAEESILYCSHVSCAEISKRVQQDNAAQKTLLHAPADSKSSLAECKLDRLTKIDVRNMNVCNGKLPDPNAPDPHDIRCNPQP
ncbi:hypothetical protein [Rhodanobacter sp. C05]|uniref:hypothetical protein n=1 Tax=Rhodanobacter sp. C05 TaxID=1945855 RepID=UPI001179AB44|nr:hypothetical protein [Rhodanobacter sp. C05]